MNNIEPIKIKTANKKGYDEAVDGDGVDLQYPNSNTRRGRVGHGVSKTIMTSDLMGVVHNYRIRKLTPKECWRLMGFDDEDFEKAAQVNSNAQLYKQAGNSIVVNVLEAIFNNLLKGEKKMAVINEEDVALNEAMVAIEAFRQVRKSTEGGKWQVANDWRF